MSILGIDGNEISMTMAGVVLKLKKCCVLWSISSVNETLARVRHPYQLTGTGTGLVPHFTTGTGFGTRSQGRSLTHTCSKRFHSASPPSTRDKHCTADSWRPNSLFTAFTSGEKLRRLRHNGKFQVPRLWCEFINRSTCRAKAVQLFNVFSSRRHGGVIGFRKAGHLLHATIRIAARKRSRSVSSLTFYVKAMRFLIRP